MPAKILILSAFLILFSVFWHPFVFAETEENVAEETPKETQAKSEEPDKAKEEPQEKAAQESKPVSNESSADINKEETNVQKEDIKVDSQPAAIETPTEQSETESASSPSNNANPENTLSENEPETVANNSPPSADEMAQADDISSSDNSTEEKDNSKSNDEEESEKEIDNENEAIIQNETASESSTGENESSDSIATQDATSETDQFNDINKNFVGENYEEYINNIYGNYEGDIDLLKKFVDILEKSKEVQPKELTVNNENSADVDNYASAAATTGENFIRNACQDANINTGDADAIVNIINFVNRNYTGDNWFFAAVNIFGNWKGNLIVPGKEDIDFLNTVQPSIDANNNNDLILKNIIETDASSGGNLSKKTEAGDVSPESNVENQVNLDKTGSNWFFLMINNMGNWTGEVLNCDDEGGENNIYNYDFGVLDQESVDFLGSLTVNNFNQADIENNAIAVADTGNNQISGQKGKIKTGDAMAIANIFNLINNNIVGNNWFFGIVNVMGTWDGNLMFGYSKNDDNKDEEEDHHHKHHKHKQDKNKAIYYGYYPSTYFYDNFATSIEREYLEIKEFDMLNSKLIPDEKSQFQIIVGNVGPVIVYNVKVYSQMFDGIGRKIAEYAFDIPAIEAGKKFKIDYEILLDQIENDELYRAVAFAQGDSANGKTGSNEVEKYLFSGEWFNFKPAGWTSKMNNYLGKMVLAANASSEPQIDLTPKANNVNSIDENQEKDGSKKLLIIWTFVIISYLFAMSAIRYTRKIKELEIKK